MARGQTPEFTVRIKYKDEWHPAGAGWVGEDGGVLIRLNVLVLGAEWDELPMTLVKRKNGENGDMPLADPAQKKPDVPEEAKPKAAAAKR